MITVRNKLYDNQKDFYRFYLSSYVEELPDNSFLNFTFKGVYICSAPKLRRIHKNSFSSTTEITLTYDHFGDYPTKLVNNPPDFDLYAALSSLVNADNFNINLEWYRNHEIPDYAFRAINGKQYYLKSIMFNGQFNISRIGNYAFYPIANITKIYLERIPVGFISAHAFDFEDSSSDYLIINLVNSSLTENSFETGVFTNSKRPLKVYLGKS